MLSGRRKHHKSQGGVGGWQLWAAGAEEKNEETIYAQHWERDLEIMNGKSHWGVRWHNERQRMDQ